MNDYSAIIIIYNPISTGPSKDLAAELHKKIKKLMPGKLVKLIATEHQGHAEELAYHYACASPKPLIISSSGDGGYHEVVNGLVRAQETGAKPVAGLLPAGNANDHYRTTHHNETIDGIKKNDIARFDLLQVTFISKGTKQVRYAHSYAGIGFSPKAGNQLNKIKLNHFNEIAVVLRVLFKLQPTRLIVDGKARSYDSLIFSNIGAMAKILTVAKTARPDDDKFEVTAFYRRHKLRLIIALLKASLVGLENSRTVQNFTFKTTKPTLIQLDGEIYTIDQATNVTVKLSPKKLICIV